MTRPDFRSGLVALVGRPNVGKSTLLNRLVGQKVSIVTRRAQTTRHRILGVRTSGDYQAVFIDTPGLHKTSKRALNRQMNRAAMGGVADVHVVVMIVEALRWTEEDDWVLSRIASSSTSVILVANKVDRIKPKSLLLPWLQEVQGKADWLGIIPLSARRDVNVDRLVQQVAEHLPAAPPIFPEDQVTDRSLRFLAAEIVREKLMHRLNAEIPHRLAVEIEHFKEAEKNTNIRATIWVESKGQKGIVIGQEGQVLKAVGIAARRELERLTENHVRLDLWVKVKAGWSDDERALQLFGYVD